MLLLLKRIDVADWCSLPVPRRAFWILRRFYTAGIPVFAGLVFPLALANYLRLSGTLLLRLVCTSDACLPDELRIREMTFRFGPVEVPRSSRFHFTHDLALLAASSMLTMFVHEFGHVLSAKIDGINTVSVGVGLIACVTPVGFVDLDKQQLECAPLIAKLRAFTAGVWHNVLLYIVCSMVQFLISFVVTLCHPKSLYIADIQHPLVANNNNGTSLLLLLLGSEILALNGCPVHSQADLDRRVSCLVMQQANQHDECNMLTTWGFLRRFCIPEFVFDRYYSYSDDIRSCCENSGAGMCVMLDNGLDMACVPNDLLVGMYSWECTSDADCTVPLQSFPAVPDMANLLCVNVAHWRQATLNGTSSIPMPATGLIGQRGQPRMFQLTVTSTVQRFRLLNDEPRALVPAGELSNRGVLTFWAKCDVARNELEPLKISLVPVKPMTSIYFATFDRFILFVKMCCYLMATLNTLPLHCADGYHVVRCLMADGPRATTNLHTFRILVHCLTGVLLIAYFADLMTGGNR